MKGNIMFFSSFRTEKSLFFNGLWLSVKGSSCRLLSCLLAENIPKADISTSLLTIESACIAYMLI